MRSQPLDPYSIVRKLRELPSELPPPVSWEEFQRRACAGPQRSSVWTWRHAAMAAGLAGLVAGIALWSRIGPSGSGVQINSTQSELPMLALPDPRSMQQAEASERWLARLPAEPVVMRVGTRSAVADLEDRIAWMDDVLSAERPDAIDPTHIVALQHERARLVNSLAQVRFAETLVAAAQ